jgi:hypothetical protein
MDQVTTQLGSGLRDFKDITCVNFKTKELEREADARYRREARAAAKQRNQSSGPQKSFVPPQTPHGRSLAPSGADQQSSSSRHHFDQSTDLSNRTETTAMHDPSSTQTSLPPCSPIFSTCPDAGPQSNSGSLRQRQQLRDQGDQSAGKHEVKFTLETYKHHALGDYVETIRQYGTTDSYSTESVLSPFIADESYSLILLSG